MEGKTVLVINGINEIGTTICCKFAQSGARVIAAFQNENDLQLATEWQKIQKSNGYDVAIKHIDATKSSACSDAVSDIEKQFHRIDILVNNTVIDEYCSNSLSSSQTQDDIKNNLNNIFNITRDTIAIMMRNKFGRIINITNENGSINPLIKLSIHGFTKSLSKDVFYKNITVNTIFSNIIDDNFMFDEEIDAIVYDKLDIQHEVARAALFFSSTESRYITGSNLVINSSRSI